MARDRGDTEVGNVLDRIVRFWIEASYCPAKWIVTAPAERGVPHFGFAAFWPLTYFLPQADFSAAQRIYRAHLGATRAGGAVV
jgi:hypothetical protein